MPADERYREWATTTRPCLVRVWAGGRTPEAVGFRQEWSARGVLRACHDGPVIRYDRLADDVSLGGAR